MVLIFHPFSPFHILHSLQHPENTPIILHQQACEPCAWFISFYRSLSPSLPLSLSPLPPLFSSVCFHSPSFRVITWHLHCKVPNAALSSSAGDWASFPQQIRERKRKRERKRGLRQGVMLFWIAGYRNNAPNSLLFSLSGSERTQNFFF